MFLMGWPRTTAKQDKLSLVIQMIHIEIRTSSDFGVESSKSTVRGPLPCVLIGWLSK